MSEHSAKPVQSALYNLQVFRLKKLYMYISIKKLCKFLGKQFLYFNVSRSHRKYFCVPDSESWTFTPNWVASHPTQTELGQNRFIKPGYNFSWTVSEKLLNSLWHLNKVTFFARDMHQIRKFVRKSLDNLRPFLGHPIKEWSIFDDMRMSSLLWLGTLEHGAMHLLLRS